MPGLLDRSLDRELGPAPGEQRRAVRDSWLRDLPLLLGLAASACLIGASTTVGTPDRPAPSIAGKPAAAGPGNAPGTVVDVGDGTSHAAPAAASPAPAKPKAHKAHARKSAHAAGGSDGTPSAEPADTSPSPGDPAAGSSSGSGSPSAGQAPSARRRSGGRRSAAQAPTPGQARIVNVTGTSAAFSNGPLSYAFSAPTHTPVVGKSWRLLVSVKRSGAPVAGTVRVDILHDGSIVGHAASGKLARGRFAHGLDWPDEAAGYPLTVKTTVTAGGVQQSFLFTVKVRKATG